MAKKSHYQSKVFFCLSVISSADAVDRLFILYVLDATTNHWRASVDIRGSALPSAAKSNNYHYQFKVIVCVSVISWRLGIIARMQSIDFCLA